MFDFCRTEGLDCRHISDQRMESFEALDTAFVDVLHNTDRNRQQVICARWFRQRTTAHFQDVQRDHNYGETTGARSDAILAKSRLFATY